MENNNRGFYICVLILSVLFLIIGHRIASAGMTDTDVGVTENYYTGVITEILERTELFGMGWTPDSVGINVTFSVRLTRGERRGEIITAGQQLNDFYLVNEREVSVGNRVILYHDPWGDNFHFAGYVRINYVIVLGVVFLALVILFGRKKGFDAIVALGLTCLAIFWVFIPAILAGRNVYAATVVICVFAIVSTLLIVIGPNKKALSAMGGCLGGVLLSGLLMFVMDLFLRLTGALDRETQSLILLDNPIDLNAIIFAGVILGAVGAIMDVAMSIASSLWEVKEAGGVSDFKSIFKSGINIGKDILGTMLNTLILAYLGSSLSLLLLVTSHNPSLLILLNMEMIIVQFLRALVGSFGMLLTIPLTAAICGRLYTYERDDNYDEIDEYFKPKVR
jgi:uncharacterized membrane protein